MPRVILPLLLLVTLASAAWACRCAMPPPPKESLEKATAVFVGKVSALKIGDEKVVTLTISQTWKGTVGKEIVVRTPTSGAACGFGFEMGKSYLVYANVEGEGAEAKLYTNICTRTKALETAKDDLKELGEGKAP